MKTNIFAFIATVLMASTVGCSSPSDSVSTPTIRSTISSSSSPQDNMSVDCKETPPAAMVESISETFEFPDEQIETWYCSGESIEDILLALQTSELTNLDPEELLERKDDIGWDQLWEELNLAPTLTP